MMLSAAITMAVLAPGAVTTGDQGAALADSQVTLVAAGQPRAEVVVGAGCSELERRGAHIFVQEVERRTCCLLKERQRRKST
jgi:hypothetical protein